jgi:hypothetical protein
MRFSEACMVVAGGGPQVVVRELSAFSRRGDRVSSLVKDVGSVRWRVLVDTIGPGGQSDCQPRRRLRGKLARWKERFEESKHLPYTQRVLSRKNSSSCSNRVLGLCCEVPSEA